MKKPTKPRNTYKKPKVGDNKELKYTLNGHGLLPGDKVAVEWPDKTVTVESIIGKKHYLMVRAKWGGFYYVATQKLFIRIHHRGKEAMFPLEELKIKMLTSS